MFKKLIIITILLLAVSSGIYAQKRMGGQFITDRAGNPYLEVRIVVEGSKSVSQIDEYGFANPSDVLSIKKPIIRGAGRNVVEYNGIRTVTSSITVYFPFTALKEGEHIIPPIIISVASKKYQTLQMKARFFKIGKSRYSTKKQELTQADVIKFRLSTKTKTAYPRQGIIVCADLLFIPLSNSKPSTELDFPFIQHIGKNNFKPISPLLQSNARQHFLLQDRSGKIEFIQNGTEIIADREYMKLTGWFKVYAKEPGELALSSSKVMRLYKGSFIDDSIRVFATSNPLTIQIKNFPKENQTASVNDPVGKYSISTIVDSTEVRVGEPLLLTLTISGDGILDNIRKPNLSNIKEFADQFKISKNSSPGEIKGESITYKYAIRPIKKDIKAIPAVPFSYFDIDTETYTSVSSNTIPLKVLESGVVSKSDIISNSEQTKPLKKETISSSEGILSIYNGKEALTDSRIHLSLLLWLLFMPIGFVVVFIIHKKRSVTDVAAERYKAARKKADKYMAEANNNINQDSFYEYIAKGMMNYIADKFNLGEGEITVPELEKIFKVKAIPENLLNELLTDLKTIFTNAETGRFSSKKSNDNHERDNLLNLALKTIDCLESFKIMKR